MTEEKKTVDFKDALAQRAEAVENMVAGMARARGEVPGYESLRAVLDRAYDQASRGKGRERHATGEPFHEQQIVVLGRWMKTTGFNVGQACKKSLESLRLPREKAVAELLGAVNYLAGAIILLESEEGLVERGITTKDGDETAHSGVPSPKPAALSLTFPGGFTPLAPGEEEVSDEIKAAPTSEPQVSFEACDGVFVGEHHSCAASWGAPSPRSCQCGCLPCHRARLMKASEGLCCPHHADRVLGCQLCQALSPRWVANANKVRLEEAERLVASLRTIKAGGAP